MKKIKIDPERKCKYDFEGKRHVCNRGIQSQHTETLIHVFSKFCISLCFAEQFVISLDPQSGVEDQSGRWRRSRKEKDEPGRGGWRYGVGKGSMGRAGCGEMRQEKGGGSVFADPLSGASAPDPPFPPFTSSSRAHHHLHLHPPLKRADGLGQSGRRREADKRIALSSRNDIFDQHFHITPAEALSRITPLSYSRILRLLSSLFHFLPFPPFSTPSSPSAHWRRLARALIFFRSSILLVLSISQFVLSFLVHFSSFSSSCMIRLFYLLLFL